MLHKRETIIWLPSRYVNAAIFCIVDILGLWCIHRCLKALQSYYLYWLARSGKTVPIARSRIPIFSGELLFGVTRTGSLFVIANTAAIVVAFCATLFVNGETRYKWKPLNLTNATTLIGGLASWNQTSSFFPAVASCTTTNDTSVAFWPVAFNLSRNQYRASRNTWLRPLNSSCLKDTFNSQPLVSVSCIDIDTSPCSIYEQRPDIEIDVIFSPSSNKTWNRLVTELNFSTTASDLVYRRERSKFDLLIRKQGFAFIFREPVEEFANRNIAYVFIADPKNDSWFLSAGQMVSRNSGSAKFLLYRPARVLPQNVLGPLSNVLIPFRKKALLPRPEVPASSIPILAQFLFRQFGSAARAKQSFRKIPQDVTIIYKEAIILYSALLGVLLVLFFTKEIIIIFFISRKDGISSEEVFATDFNELSKTLRRTMEREQDLQYSNDHALLGIHVDERGSRRVLPVSSPPVTSFY